MQRQAYHGQSFVGNHVNKMLKVSIFLKNQDHNEMNIYDDGTYRHTFSERKNRTKELNLVQMTAQKTCNI